MDKLKMQTTNKADENFRALAAMFPNAVTEIIDENGEVVRAIDKDVLMQEISVKVVEGKEERYQFTWPDKKKAILAANAPITATLRPLVADSVGRDGTPGGFDSENLYIEGDNLEVLKLLQETYLGKIKMIYIDPPYNTGNDFVYEDDFSQSADEYMENSGQFDEEGNRMVTNTESNGRFHTDWLNMMYTRLRTAKTLLADDGIIFITLDDNENAHTRMICDEIFGENNFITEFIWEKKKKPSFLHKNVGKVFDYILCYARDSMSTCAFSVERTTEGKKYPVNNAGNSLSTLIFPPYTVEFSMPDCVVEPQDMSEGNIITKLLNRLIIRNCTNDTEMQLSGEWRYSQQRINEILACGERFVISKIPFRPNHIKAGGEIKKMRNTLSPSSYNCETNEDGSAQIIELFGVNVFDAPKPIQLIKLLIQSITYMDDAPIVLDFFSGSATTAHAVMQLNAEDGGHRKFIMVQLPEKTDEKSEAYKAGYKNICEIGKERIRRAGRKIKEEAGLTAPADLDIGFRCLRLDESNMQQVYYTPDAVAQRDLFSLVDNVKPDRTPEDLLFQVMLDLGVLLSSSIEVKEIAGKKVFNVADGFLLACFDTDATDETVRAIAQMKPCYAVFRDSSMANDSVATNFDEIFKSYSPDTVRKVL